MEEHKRVLGSNNVVDESNWNELKLTNAVVSEALRFPFFVFWFWFFFFIQLKNEKSIIVYSHQCRRWNVMLFVMSKSKDTKSRKVCFCSFYKHTHTHTHLKQKRMIGSLVSVFMWAPQVDAAHWSEPLSFRPHRWLTDRQDERHPFAYTPFSAGFFFVVLWKKHFSITTK